MAAQYANNEMKRHENQFQQFQRFTQPKRIFGNPLGEMDCFRLRSDHDQAIGNLAENMNRPWL